MRSHVKWVEECVWACQIGEEQCDHMSAGWESMYEHVKDVGKGVWMCQMHRYDVTSKGEHEKLFTGIMRI